MNVDIIMLKELTREEEEDYDEDEDADVDVGGMYNMIACQP